MSKVNLFWLPPEGEAGAGVPARLKPVLPAGQARVMTPKAKH